MDSGLRAGAGWRQPGARRTVGGGLDTRRSSQAEAQGSRSYAHHRIGADDGRWKGEWVRNGVTMEFHAGLETGAITKEKPDKD